MQAIIIQMYKEGLGLTRISRNTDFPRSRIYKILKENNVSIRPQKQSQKLRLHNNWKGGKYVDSTGRIWISTKEGQILESHYIFKKFYNLERIPENYVIHHVDLNKANNDIKNLELMHYSSHHKLHNKILWSKTAEVVIVPKYDEEVKSKCVEMVKQGVALAQITKKLGPNPKAIQRYCKKAGVEMPKKVKVEKAKTEAPKVATKQ